MSTPSPSPRSEPLGPFPSGGAGPHGRHAPRVCVIGAGCSGLLTLKALREAGIECRAFELGSRIGGLWAFQNDNGRGGAYRSLRINTSAQAMALEGLAWPPGTEDYPHHSDVARYFETLAERHQLRSLISFRHEVERCEPAPGGGYQVTTRNVESGVRTTEFFERLVVANGHHWSPRFPPDKPGTFSGKVLHSHDYVDPTTPYDLRGKRVLVVGLGNSAVDIACELAQVGQVERVALSARRGVWVIPKYVRGKPVDQGHVVPYWLPGRLRRHIVTGLFRLLYGRMRDYGLPEPDHLIGEAHPTLSSDLARLVQAGAIGIHPEIAGYDSEQVTFSDGRSEAFDVIVFATGYDVRFPFFDPDHISAPDNRLPLFRRVFHPEHRDVFFVGLAQPLGAIMPIAELQAEWIAAHLSGRYTLPSSDRMLADMASEERERARRYGAAPRHTMQIEFEGYLHATKQEMRRGKSRAAAKAQP